MQMFKKFKEGKEKPRVESSTETAVATSQTHEPDSVTGLKPRPGATHGSPQSPVLSEADERWFEALTAGSGYSDADGKRPPLPERMNTPEISWDSDSESFVAPAPSTTDAAPTSTPANPTSLEKGKGKEIEHHHHDKSNDNKTNRFSFITRTFTTKKKTNEKELKPTNPDIPEKEEEREKSDMSKVLDDLNFSAKNNKTFSLSEDSAEMMNKFTQILKDLVNGVPTAAGDLQNLLQDHDGTLARNYDKLPSSLKKLVTTLPTKLTGSLAPELLAVAAESQGLRGQSSGGGGLKSQAMNLLVPKNLAELVTKPSAIVGMLKAILNALKLRWPAFVGTSAIWSVAISLLLFVLWYCYKRGRETRLEREGSTDAAGRVLGELPDDLALEAGPSGEKAATNSPALLAPDHHEHEKVKK